MTDEHKKSWYTRLPALSAALVAFLVALTTLIKNVVEIRVPPAPPAAVAPAGPAVEAPAAPQAPKKTTVVLTLEKIEVLNDGTNGSTSWSFEIEAGGQSLFELPPRDYNDSEASRVVTPRATDPSMARVVLVPGQEMPVKVVGRSSGLISKTVATGSATLGADGPLAPVRVLAEDGRGGSFVFHFGTSASSQ